MRWIVEVSSVGKADKQSYCVESESWQRALQAARGIRDDHGPMTGYSIELLDEGFSAVDPMTRLRYFVKRAADDTPLTSVPAGAPKSPSVIPPAMPAEESKSAKPAPTPRAAVPSASKGKGRASTVVFGSTGTALLAEAQAAATAGREAAAPAPQARQEVPRPKPTSVPPPPPSKPADSSPQSGGTVISPPPAVTHAVAHEAPPPAPAHAHAPTPPLAPPPVAPPPARPALISAPTLPGIEILYKREQDPDSTSPLTYREYVYFFPAASDETMARAMLVAQFEMVRASLEPVRAGKLVNLAMFDVSFKGRPAVPPVVTLTWKDWKGEPAIDFPRRRQVAPVVAHTTLPASSPAAGLAPASVSSAPMPPPAPSAASHSTQPSAVAPTYPEPGGFPPPRVAAAPHPQVQQQVQQHAPVQPAPVVQENHVAAALAPQYIPQIAPQYPAHAAPPQPAAVQPAPVQPAPQPQAATPAPQYIPQQAAPQYIPQQAAPVPQYIPQQAASAPQYVPQQPAPAPPPQVAAPPAAPATPIVPNATRRGSKPTVRLRGDELIADLFEAMHDLHFLRDSVEGADFCLSLALEKIPSRAGIVHLYDIDRREFVVACARGPNQESILLRRFPEGDPILSAAMRRNRAIVWSDASQTNGLERYVMLGGARSLVVAPVVLAGRFLGAIELIDPSDGSPFSDQEGHALTYIGEQFAEFVNTRGVTVDPERIVASIRP
jgi:hypothetical protein